MGPAAAALAKRLFGRASQDRLPRGRAAGVWGAQARHGVGERERGSRMDRACPAERAAALVSDGDGPQAGGGRRLHRRAGWQQGARCGSGNCRHAGVVLAPLQDASHAASSQRPAHRSGAGLPAHPAGLTRMPACSIRRRLRPCLRLERLKLPVYSAMSSREPLKPPSMSEPCRGDKQVGMRGRAGGSVGQSVRCPGGKPEGCRGVAAAGWRCVHSGERARRPGAHEFEREWSSMHHAQAAGRSSRAPG